MAELDSFGLVVVVIIAVVGLTGLGLEFESVYGQEGITAFGTAISATLSGLLVLLYSQQKNVLENQTQIMKREWKGDLRLVGHEFDGPYLRLQLSNVSDSVVRNIQIHTKIFPNEIDGKRYRPDGYRITREQAQDTYRKQASYLSEKEEAVPFKTSLNTIEVPPEGEDRVPSLRHLCNRLAEEGHEEIEVLAWVSGEDQLGRTLRTPIHRRSRVIDLSEVRQDSEKLEDILGRTPLGDHTYDEVISSKRGRE
jgi:hypothetical protein